MSAAIKRQNIESDIKQYEGKKKEFKPEGNAAKL